MSKVTIFHNVSRDGSFGYVTGQDLVPVFMYESDTDANDVVLNRAFETFNVGEGKLAQEYRARRLRSLSVGDVVQIDTRFYSVERFGFKPASFLEMSFLVGRDAAPVIRARYDIPKNEALSITVPLPL
jgi:hypothetical protein